jgi:hypothetical protein
LGSKRYVYVWADGFYVQARLETEAQGLLVITAPQPMTLACPDRGACPSCPSLGVFDRALPCRTRRSGYAHRHLVGHDHALSDNDHTQMQGQEALGLAAPMPPGWPRHRSPEL